MLLTWIIQFYKNITLQLRNSLNYETLASLYVDTDTLAFAIERKRETEIYERKITERADKHE